MSAVQETRVRLPFGTIFISPVAAERGRLPTRSPLGCSPYEQNIGCKAYDNYVRGEDAAIMKRHV